MAGKPQQGREVALTPAARVTLHRRRQAARCRRLTETLARVVEAKTIAEARRLAQVALQADDPPL